MRLPPSSSAGEIRCRMRRRQGRDDLTCVNIDRGVQVDRSRAHVIMGTLFGLAERDGQQGAGSGSAPGCLPWRRPRRPPHHREVHIHLRRRPMRYSQGRRRAYPRQCEHPGTYPVRNLTRATRRRPIHQPFHPIFLITLNPFVHRRPRRLQHRGNLTLPTTLAIPQHDLSPRRHRSVIRIRLDHSKKLDTILFRDSMEHIIPALSKMQRSISYETLVVVFPYNSSPS